MEVGLDEVGGLQWFICKPGAVSFPTLENQQKESKKDHEYAENGGRDQPGGVMEMLNHVD